MVMRFTEQEQKYILFELGGWKVKEDCPKDVREKLERKIQMIEKSDKGQNHMETAKRG